MDLANLSTTAHCYRRYGPGFRPRPKNSPNGSSSLVNNSAAISTQMRILTSISDVLAPIFAWWITFAVVLILLACVGFNTPGIGAGRFSQFLKAVAPPITFCLSIETETNEDIATAAAMIQSCVYGGFTPAGGIFATLTSMGMLGTLMPVQVICSAVLATVVTVVVWACGAGT